MAVRHDPERDAGQDVIDDEGGGGTDRVQPVPDEEDGGAPHPSRRVPWWLWLALALLVAGAVYAFSRGCDSALPPVVKPPAPTAPAPPSTPGTPPTFEDIVLEVDPVKFLVSCLAAGGTEAECQATLDDMTVK